MTQSSNKARHRARRLLVQALYQWQLTGDDADEVLRQFLEGRDMAGADGEFFREALLDLTADIDRIDAAIEPLLERSLAMVDPVERAILRLASYELFERLEVPVRVVINEAVGLAREFGAVDGHRFVNGLIDRLAHRVRAHEFGTASPRS